MSALRPLVIALSLSIIPGSYSSLIAAQIDFSRDVEPIFEQACQSCHGSKMSMGGLRLDSEAGVLRGGKSGPAITPGKNGDSLLIKRVLGLVDGPRMPMGAQSLDDAKVQMLKQWIDTGNFTNVAAAPKAATAGASGPAPVGTGDDTFATKVRPILASRCYQCHGPNVQQNGLRVDSLAALLKGSESGKVVTAGDSANSRLIERLMAKERPQMPYGGPPLSTEEIATIRKWIDKGAEGPDSSAPLGATKPLKHWAYMKPVRPVEPAVKDAKWVRNPIDKFILAKLEREGLHPAPEADKAVLLRRVYLDLTGLPPSPKDVDAYLADHSSDAYEKVVDRLLASPRYGERWARPWLDLARYADTNGYEKDNRRTAWEYRDWVIRALNADMPFSEFTIEQIAGDMLPHPTTSQLIATGFQRNSLLNQEGGVDPDEYYWYELVDRVNTTAAVWLGSTLGCAQCHNHKFDPFTQKDYYRFVAFYSNSEYKIAGDPIALYAQEPEIELPDQKQAKAAAEIRDDLKKLELKLDTQTPQLNALQTAWESRMRTAEQSWTKLKPVKAESQGGATLTVQKDDSVLASGKNPNADTYVLSATTDLKQITGVRLEELSDDSLPQSGPGRDAEGNFFLSDFDVEAAPLNDRAAKQKVVWTSAKSDESQAGYAASRLVRKAGEESDTGLHGWAVDKTLADVKLRQAVFIPKEPFGFAAGTALTITLKHEMRHASRNMGRFRLSLTGTKDPEFLVSIPASVRPILSVPAASRSSKQIETLSAAYRDVSPSLDDTRKQIKALNKNLEDLKIPTAMVMQERPTFTRPSAYIRERGSFASKGDLVYADVPSSLGSLSHDSMPNRLGLAEWLVSPDNPLTARVTVNHFWETIFGHGIVETAEDFGSQGDPPSHPKLLDWLACEFVSSGWDMKKIQRLIVTSATYRQSSKASRDLLARDPYNKLYARGPRFRVEAEMVHDIALSESGLLSSKMYGPSVFPYQPPGVWDMPYSTDKWIESTGEDRYRRSVYTFVRRSAPYPSLVTYDAPSREFCTVRRVRTNTPLQALTSLNDPFFFNAARAFAKRIEAEGGTTEESRATYGFRLAVSRAPSPEELSKLVGFYNEQARNYEKDRSAATQTIGSDNAEREAKPAELAAWTMVANVLLNMDETITKD